MGEDEEEQTSKKLSSRQVGESEVRVEDEETETKKELGGISAEDPYEGVGSHVCERTRGQQERRGISMAEKWTRRCN